MRQTQHASSATPLQNFTIMNSYNPFTAAFAVAWAELSGTAAKKFYSDTAFDAFENALIATVATVLFAVEVSRAAVATGQTFRCYCDALVDDALAAERDTAQPLLSATKIAGLLMPCDVIVGDAPMPAVSSAHSHDWPTIALSKLTVKELRRRCKAKGVAYTAKDRKADLVAKLSHQIPE